MEPIFEVDESGDLATGYFYSLITASFSNWRPELGQTKDWIVSSSDSEYRFVRAVEVRSKNKEIHDCPLDPSHATLTYSEEMDVDLFNGDSVGPFVPIVAATLISLDLARQLEESGLSGVHTVAVRVAENQSACNDPKMRLLQFRGKNVIRWPRIYPESANHCPYCGQGPIICPACGHRQLLCGKCGRDWSRLAEEKRKGAHDRRIPTTPSPDLGPIIEPGRWDGTDFVAYGIITRRALDFFLGVHAAPLRAQPLRVDLRGITAEKRELLETVKKPVKAVRPRASE